MDIERVKKEFGENLNIIATGGLSNFIIPYCKEKMVIDDNLILKGLYTIYQKNI